MRSKEVRNCLKIVLFIKKLTMTLWPVGWLSTFCYHEDVGADRVFQMLNTFIWNSSPDDLDDFLRFVSGSRSSATCILPKRITVSCAATNSLFASTCLLDLKLSNHFDSYKDFESAMRCVIKGNCTFTTVWISR